ncbi:hypothetical protein B0A48_03032 [Cryoendolithus antarcticus]|uniref:CRAL-TRIO domain-containing protein n=1 Tax=Cryoendolithus antarcticus TaxID=1507870 RepID=A0A1V8TLZ0_9PEZI|nr:hypothetical protein B0A48_03032 [Cryoendolithus antarcticus]
MSRPDGAPLQRVDSYQFPAGHVGHLTDGQFGQLTKFKDLCQSKGYWTPGSAGKPASHDDETLLRYLRARKFLPNEAFAQFKDTEDWRKENQIDKLYETIEVEEYERERRLYPQWLGVRDKRGIPLYLFEVANLDSKAMTAPDKAASGKKHAPVNTKVPPKMLRLFALYENLCTFVLPLCSDIPNRPNQETPISQSNNIVDISGVGLRQFWNLKQHMQDASLLATAHYPETLDRIFIIGAPSFFPTVWGWIKRWFDPVTVSKIFILSAANANQTLLQYIDKENIPEKYGGLLRFKFGDLPKLEPAIANELQWQENVKSGNARSFPTGPIHWRKDENGNLNAIAVGTENGKPRNRLIATLPAKVAAAVEEAPASRLMPPATLMRTTTGEATHPPTPPDSVTDRRMSDLADHDVEEHASGEYTPPSTVSGESQTLPIREEKPTTAPEPTLASPPEGVRQGTSNTRLEQQGPTHASGTLEQGTPEVIHGAAGDKVAVMEPSTIGQAPKEHPVPEPEHPQPSVIDTAKEYAGIAYTQAAQLPSTVLAAVGLGGHKPEEPTQSHPVEDPAVDKLESQTVEEFLREKTKSAAAASA